MIDFGDLPVFDATTYPTVLVLRKAPPAAEQATQTLVVEDIGVVQRLVEEVTGRAWPQKQLNLGADGWTLVRPEKMALLKKLRTVGKPLGEVVNKRFYRGIVTGLNQAFVIDESTRNRLVAEDPRSDQVLRPWIRGRHIKRWQIETSSEFLIWAYQGVPITQYPAVLRHLD